MPSSRSPLQRYAVSLLAVGVAFGLTLLLQSALASAIFTFFYLSILVSALYGGMGAGSLASVLSVLVCQYFFLPPVRSLAIPDPDTAIWLATVLGMALLISALGSAFRRTQHRAKAALRRLQTSEAHYRRIVDTANEGIWLMDADQRTRYVNDRLTEMLGYSADELQGRSMQDFLDPSFQQQATAHWAPQQGSRSRYEACYRRKDGSPLWAIVSVTPTLDEQGSLVEALAMLVDISDAKREEASRRQAEAERHQAEVDRHRAEAERQQAEAERFRAEAERQQIADAQQQAEQERQRLEQQQQQIEAARHAEEQERLRIEQALKQSEARFFQISRHIQDVFWMMTLGGDLLYVSPAYEEIWGRTCSSLYENPADWMAAVHPDDRAQVQLSHERLLTGEAVEVQYQIVRPDGSVRWVRDRGFPIRRDGEIYQFAGIVEDITASQQEELRRQQAEQQFSLYANIVQNTQVGISVWRLTPTPEGDRFYLVAANPAANQMLGIAIDQQIGAEMTQSFPALPETLLHTYREVVQTGIGQDMGEVSYQDSTVTGVFTVKAFALPDRCLGLAFENMTERKQTEEALQNALQRLTVHFEISPLGVIERDREQRTIRWSKAAERIFGWRADEVLGRNLKEFNILHPDDAEAVLQLRQRLLSGIDKQNVSYNRSITKSGSVVYCEWYNSAVFDESGKIVSLLSLVHDVTDRHQAEQERERLLAREREARAEAEAANRSKDEFLAVLSHELRSPLNPILGWAKLLQARELDAETTVRALETIERNAKLQAQLVEDLLDVSRIIRGKLSLNIHPVSLPAVIEAAIETVQLSADAKAIDLRFHAPADRPFTVAGDANRLQQIVWNLLSNAVKFTPEGGRITIDLQYQEQPDRSPSGHALLTVADTGRGIASDFLPYVFDYFRQSDSSTTRSVGGLGLGLAIVRHLVELHGGSVWAESAGEGQGTTLFVSLPLTEAEEPIGPLPVNQLDAAAAQTATPLDPAIAEFDQDTRFEDFEQDFQAEADSPPIAREDTSSPLPAQAWDEFDAEFGTGSADEPADALPDLEDAVSASEPDAAALADGRTAVELSEPKAPADQLETERSEPETPADEFAAEQLEPEAPQTDGQAAEAIAPIRDAHGTPIERADDSLLLPGRLGLEDTEFGEVEDDWSDAVDREEPAAEILLESNWDDAENDAEDVEPIAPPAADDWGEWDDEEMTEWLGEASPAPTTITVPSEAVAPPIGEAVSEEGAEPAVAGNWEAAAANWHEEDWEDSWDAADEDDWDQPEAEAFTPSAPQPDRGDRTGLAEVRVLIVDDDADMREFLATTLEAAGAVAFVMPSTEAALTALSAIQPDLLISGTTAAERRSLIENLRSLPPTAGGGVPAIALVTDSSEAVPGFQQRLTKPVDSDRLLAAIAIALNKP